MGKSKESIRYAKPISLSPLSPEEALRRAMNVPVQKDDPKLPKSKKKSVRKKIG